MLAYRSLNRFRRYSAGIPRTDCLLVLDTTVTVHFRKREGKASAVKRHGYGTGKGVFWQEIIVNRFQDKSEGGGKRGGERRKGKKMMDPERVC